MSQSAEPIRPTAASQAATLARLRRALAQRVKETSRANDTHSSGCPALDRILPAGGLQRGTLVDWLYASRAGGAGTLALTAAREALAHDTSLVVIDPGREFYPPAAVTLGIDLGQLVLIRPATQRDTLWAWEQALRSPAIGAVWGLMSRIEPRAFRRLQLAAEAGRAVGHLVRPAGQQNAPGWAHIQLLVGAGSSGRRRVTVTRAGQGCSGQSIELDPFTTRLRHASPPFLVAPALADSTLGRRARGA